MISVAPHSHSPFSFFFFFSFLLRLQKIWHAARPPPRQRDRPEHFACRIAPRLLRSAVQPAPLPANERRDSISERAVDCQFEKPQLDGPTFNPPKHHLSPPAVACPISRSRGSRKDPRLKFLRRHQRSTARRCLEPASRPQTLSLAHHPRSHQWRRRMSSRLKVRTQAPSASPARAPCPSP